VKGAEFRPRPIGLPNLFPDGVRGSSGTTGEPGRRILPATPETRFHRILNGLPWSEGKPLDPFNVSDALMTYQDQVSARARKLTPQILLPGEPARLVETRTPTQEDQAFLATIQHVRQAFDILAFSYFPPNYQQALSEEVHDPQTHIHQPEESIRLTNAEKAILHQFTAVVGIPDDPEQFTYSYASIPRIIKGSVRR